MFSKLKISQKIFLLSSVLASLMLIVGVSGLYQMNKIGEELVSVAERDIPLSNLITLVTEHQLQQEIYFERALFYAVLSKESEEAYDKFEVSKQSANTLAGKVRNELAAIEEFIEVALEEKSDSKTASEFSRVLIEVKKLRLRVMS